MCGGEGKVVCGGEGEVVCGGEGEVVCGGEGEVACGGGGGGRGHVVFQQFLISSVHRHYAMSKLITKCRKSSNLCTI